MDDDIEITKQYCLDNCILSGCNPKVIVAALIYLKNYKTKNYQSQEVISLEHGVSTVALRNNAHKITRSSPQHVAMIKKLLHNPKIVEGK